MIQQVKIQNCDFTLSQIIYGVWRLADDQNQAIDHITKKIDQCLDQGVDTFDHADIYGDYRCEKLFGDALRKNPDIKKKTKHISKFDIKLVSKEFPQRRVKHYDTSAAYIESSIDQSLKNLSLDCLDVYIVHRPDYLMDVDETADALDQLVIKGKVKQIGVSNFMPWDFDLLQSRMRNRILFNQIEMSALHLEPFCNGSLNHCYQHQITPMAWSPLSGGRLFSQDTDAIRLRDQLQVFADRFSVDISAVAIAWLLFHPAGILPILGTNNLDRISKIHHALRVELNRENWYEIWTASTGQDVP